jgi:tetratricopeptide (TPR) repeat protein
MTSPTTVDSDDLYERLGISRSASADAVKKAYRELLRRFPPERAPEEFKRIREAYETLSNPRSRNEYDNQPDPAVERWLTTALHAMKAEDYPVAERFFKQVLVQAPELAFVRNMLGLCFLYQEEPAKAAAQFERLLTQPDAPAAWFGNAGHAYRALKRYNDAETAFEEAVRRATDSPADYYIGLADVCLDQHAFTRAGEVLERGIVSDGTVDFQDLRYFTKLLEVRIRECSEDGVVAALQRIRVIASDADQRRLAAWKIGLLSQQLVIAGGFRFAELIANAARQLQPDDADYFALGEAARLLSRNDHATVELLVAGHVSFAPDGWLHHLGGWIRRYCADHPHVAQMEPIAAAPPLYTLNGIGTTLYGCRDEDAQSGSHVSTLYFVFLFIPLFPIGCYRVIPRGAKAWSFLGKVPYSKREKRHWVAFAAGVVLLFWSCGSNPESSGSYGSTYVTPTASTPPTAPSAGAAGLGTTPTYGSPYGPPLAPQPSGGQSEPYWYDGEKSNVERLETSVKTLDSQLASSESEIDDLTRRIRAIEGGYGAYSTSDYEYDRLIERHNSGVRDHNDVLLQRRMAYNEYKSALDAFNQHVDEYNNRRRR